MGTAAGARTGCTSAEGPDAERPTVLVSGAVGPAWKNGRVLKELPDGLDAAAVDVMADNLLQLVRQAARVEAKQVPVLLHGEGTSAWPALLLAARLGLSTRIGLENVLVLPDGAAATDNAALVRAARHILAHSVLR
jgi:uncharacterized protein (DUF849 family)